jgi:hypothetical protein
MGTSVSGKSIIVPRMQSLPAAHPTIEPAFPRRATPTSDRLAGRETAPLTGRSNCETIGAVADWPVPSV